MSDTESWPGDVTAMAAGADRQHLSAPGDADTCYQGQQKYAAEDRETKLDSGETFDGVQKGG